MCKIKEQWIGFLADVLPDSCPFQRDIKIGNKVLFTVPPICEINPWYNEIVQLKLKRLGYIDEEPIL